MAKATSKKTSSSAKKTSAESKKIASKSTDKVAAAKKKTVDKKVAVEKVDLTDSDDKMPAKSKAASKTTASSSPSSKKKTVTKKVAKKSVAKKASGKKVASKETSGSSAKKPASKTTSKKKAAAKAVAGKADDTANSATNPVQDKNVTKKAVSKKVEAAEVADIDNDDDMDMSELPSGLSKAPVPYERNAGHYMDSAQLSHFSEKLAEWKQQLMEEVDRTVGHMKDDATNFPDPNDRATQEEEFSLELRTRDRERKLIKKINEAQKRIDDDEYGYCETCGIEIGVNRLEARPTAELCIDCKTLEEIRERQTA